MKISSKTRDSDSINNNINSVVKKKLVNQFVRVVAKPMMNLVESDEDDGLIEDN